VVGNLQVLSQNLGVGPSNAPGLLDARGAPEAQNLLIGSSAASADVIIGNVNHRVETAANLHVGADLSVGSNMTIDGAIEEGLTVNGPTNILGGTLIVVSDLGDGRGYLHIGDVGGELIDPRLSLYGDGAPGGTEGARVEAYHNDAGDPQWDAQCTLKLNAEMGTGDVIISHRDFGIPPNVGRNPTVKIESPRLRVGAPRNGEWEPQVGHIDGSGTPAEPVNLEIGTQNITNNVEIGRSGHEVDVNGRLDAEEHIRVGTGANDGKVDASANNLDLKLGTDTTRDVIICHAGQSVVVLGGTVWLNAGCTEGIRFNPAGHGGGGPSKDFISNGQVRGWQDFNGFHNP
jgi:hypothetical protein